MTQRTWQHKRWRTGAAAAAVLLLALALGAAPAHAIHQRKVAIGAGLASSRISGDLDGQTTYTEPDSGTTLLLGKPDPGRGINLYLGVTVTPHFALEVLAVGTAHDASHVAAPGVNLTMAVTTFLLGGRATLPMGDSLEVFARAGAGTSSVNYLENATTGGSVTEFSLAGTAVGLGGGLSMFFDPISVELSYLRQNIGLRALAAGKTTQQIGGRSVTANTLLLTFMVHLGQP